MHLPFRFSLLAAAAVIAMAGLAVQPAYASKKVYSPIVHAGELELEARGGYDLDDDDAKDGAQKQKYAVGYGVMDRWFTEIYAILEKEPDESFEFNEVEWENIFQLTEQGDRWVDIGLYTAYAMSLEENHADKIEVKLLLEKEWGRSVHTANLILEKEIGADAEEGTEAGLAWKSRYSWKPYLEPGFELYSDFGELRDRKPFDEQKHQLGPVVYGEFGHGFGYELGYLFGLSDAAPDGSVKWILEWETYF